MFATQALFIRTEVITSPETTLLLIPVIGRKLMFYLTTHSTHLISLWLHGVRLMVKDYFDSENGNPLPPYGLLFSITSKGSFICTIPQIR